MFSNKQKFKTEFQTRLLERYGVEVKNSCPNEQYTILGEMVRDYANVDWNNTHEESAIKGKKSLVYFSMEFLIGRLLNNNIKLEQLCEIIK